MFLYDFSFFIMYITAICVVVFLIKGFLQGKSNGYYFVIPVFILFYVVPSIIDFISGERFLAAGYSSYAYQALSDDPTVAFYNFYIALVLIVFLVASRSAKHGGNVFLDFQVVNLLKTVEKWRGLIFFMIFIPIILVFASGDIGYYKEYSDRDGTIASPLQIYAAKFAIISVPLIVFSINQNIYSLKKTGNALCLILVCVLFSVAIVNFYIHGKRSIVAIFVFFLILSFFITKIINRKTLAVVIFLTLTVFGLFIFLYGKNVDTSEGIAQALQGMRIDFSRDYNLKFVIYNELFNENKVLPYPGASYLFLLTFLIPRFVWVDKPYPYAVYFTNSFFGEFGGENLYGWGLTTSFVTEAISNFGWIGLVFFPLFYIYSLKKIDRLNGLGIKVVGYMIMVLLLIIQPIAISPLIFIFFALLFFRRKAN